MRNPANHAREQAKLRYHHAMSQQEVARELGISPTMVSIIERRALRKLREQCPEALAMMLELAPNLKVTKR